MKQYGSVERMSYGEDMTDRLPDGALYIDRQDELELGDAIYAAIKENVTIESAPWAIERVNRIMTRFAKVRGKQDEFVVVIPWTQNDYSAYTAPGRYIFFSRNLFQRCSSDDMAALVIAHEMAHHDLGHTTLVRTWFSRAAHLPFKVLVSGLYRLAEKSIYGPERERDADRLALELCVAAGYDGEKCISFFDIMEQIYLDWRDIDGVHGPDEVYDDLTGNTSWSSKIRIWLHQRQRGYHSVRDRKQMLLQHFAQMSRRGGSA